MFYVKRSFKGKFTKFPEKIPFLKSYMATLLRFLETCELCSSQRLLRSTFLATGTPLSGPLRKQNSALTGSKGHVSQL